MSIFALFMIHDEKYNIYIYDYPLVKLTNEKQRYRPNKDRSAQQQFIDVDDQHTR